MARFLTVGQCYLKITSINIGRGFYRKLDTIEAFMRAEDIAVVGLSEVDLLPGDPVPRIQGYNVFQQNTAEKIRVLVYVKESITAKQRDMDVTMPAVFLDVGQTSVAVIYNDFTQGGERIVGVSRLRRLREVVEAFEKKAMRSAALVGDFNVHWFERSEEQTFLSNWAAAAGFQQLIDGVTRSAVVNGKEHKSTIDLVFGRGKVTSAWTQEPGVSDHRAVSCKITKGSKQIHQETIKQLKVNMDVVRWAREHPPLFSEDDSVEVLNEILTDWLNIVREKCTVVKMIKVGERQRPFWYSKELEDMKKLIAILDGEEKRKQRNMYVAEVRKAKRKAERKIIEGHCKGVWEIIRKKQGREDIQLEENGILFKGKEAAVRFATFFESKPKMLQRKPKPKKVWDVFMKHIENEHSWDLKLIIQNS